MSLNDAPYTGVITINPEAVGLAAKLAASECSAIFSVAHTALSVADLDNLPGIAGEAIPIRMSIANRPTLEHRDACNRRLVAMCISDLARAIRTSMEGAAAYIDFLALGIRVREGATEEEIMETANRRLLELTAEAQALSYPPLLEKVQAGLSSKLTWAPELASFQKLRNCLEHRGGIVGERDIDDTGSLNVRLPYLEIGIIGDDGELTPIPFHVPLERDSHFGVRLSVRVESFAVGQAIAFSPSRVREIAFSVWTFADDLVSKLAVRDQG
jgi:hypothetical protein